MQSIWGDGVRETILETGCHRPHSRALGFEIRKMAMGVGEKVFGARSCNAVEYKEMRKP